MLVASFPAFATCAAPGNHLSNVGDLVALLPGNTRGALAANISSLTSGNSSTDVDSLLDGSSGDEALKNSVQCLKEPRVGNKS